MKTKNIVIAVLVTAFLVAWSVLMFNQGRVSGLKTALTIIKRTLPQ